MAFLKQKAFNGRCLTPLSNAFRFENNTLSAEFRTVAITPAAAVVVTQRTRACLWRHGARERDREKEREWRGGGERDDPATKHIVYTHWYILYVCHTLKLRFHRRRYYTRTRIHSHTSICEKIDLTMIGETVRTHVCIIITTRSLVHTHTHTRTCYAKNENRNIIYLLSSMYTYKK